MTTGSTENSDTREQSLIESSESMDFIERKSISRRRSRSKQKLSANERSVDEDEDEQETVLNVAEKKSLPSSSSSKIEIIPPNFFARKSSEETTISTNEDLNAVSGQII
jgi:hypothetical protein